jgi:hypothetical protein
VSSSGHRSGLQDALDVGSHVRCVNEVATVGRLDAALYRPSETRIIVKEARDRFQGEFNDVATIPRRHCSQPRFLFGLETDFHAIQASSATRSFKSVKNFNAMH